LDGGDDVRVRAAPAQIAAHRLSYVIIRRPAGFMEQRRRRHNLARGAVAALERIVLDESLLDRMQSAVLLEPFDRGDLVPFMHDRKRETRVDSAAIDVDGTGAALAVIAALFRAKQLEMFSQRVEKRRARVKIEGDGLAIHAQYHGTRDHTGAGPK
jgi:hypothetical protein